MFPTWFHLLSIAGLVLGTACVLVVLLDVARQPQRMAVMNVVWPVTALFGTVFTVAGCFRYGRASTRHETWQAEAGGRPRRAGRTTAETRADTPEFWFAMQLAMLAGFATAYPVNWWLIRVGVKERM